MKILCHFLPSTTLEPESPAALLFSFRCDILESLQPCSNHHCYHSTTHNWLPSLWITSVHCSHTYLLTNFSWPHSQAFQIHIGDQCNSSSSHRLTAVNNTERSYFPSSLTTQCYIPALDLSSTSTSNNSDFVFGMYNQNFLSCFLSHFSTPTKSVL